MLRVVNSRGILLTFQTAVAEGIVFAMHLANAILHLLVKFIFITREQSKTIFLFSSITIQAGRYGALYTLLLYYGNNKLLYCKQQRYGATIANVMISHARFPKLTDRYVRDQREVLVRVTVAGLVSVNQGGR